MRTAIACIAKNEDLYIKEWADYHLALGFDKVVVVANDWDYEPHRNEIMTFKIPSFEYKIQMQCLAYNTLVERFRGIYDWVAFYDVDEYLCLKKHSNIKDFIKSFYPYKPKSIAVNWAFFGDNGLEKVDEDYSLLNRFTKRQENADKHIKVIVNTKYKHIFNEQPHSSNLDWVDQSFKTGTGPFNEGGSIDVAQINHYWCKTKEEYEMFKMPNGQNWSPTLSRNLEDFQNHNFNEVEDTIARDFIASSRS
jgi:hypothetical protein